MPSDLNPAQTDGGAEEWMLVSIPMVGNGHCQLCTRRAGNLFRVPTDVLLCGDCRTAWREGYRAWTNTRAPIPPASPGREAVYAVYIPDATARDHDGEMCGAEFGELDYARDGISTFCEMPKGHAGAHNAALCPYCEAPLTKARATIAAHEATIAELRQQLEERT